MQARHGPINRFKGDQIMPYQIEAQATRGYTCRATFRVKRDAFEAVKLCACILHFTDAERAQLGESRLSPAMPFLEVVTDHGRVSVRRIG